MTFSEAVRSALRGYAAFSGRARRSEFWWFYLFTFVAGLVSSLVDLALDMVIDNEIGIVGAIVSLALLLPTLAATARRLHDTNRSGWWQLLPLVPLVITLVLAVVALFSFVFADGSDSDFPVALVLLTVAGVCVTLVASVVLIVFLCLDSTRGPNKYGPSPKQPNLNPAGPGAGYHPSAMYGPPPYGYPQQPSPGP